MKSLILFALALVSMLGIYAQSLVIDPGHGGSDPGAVGCGLRECDINLDVATRFYNLMKSAGYTVYMTRTSDATVSLASRAQYANNLGVARFVSIHCNAFNGSANGTETFCYPNGGSVSYALRDNTNPKIVAALGTYNRGCKTADYYVLRETNMPAILAELAFIDHAGDAAKLGNATYRQQAAQALKNGYVATLAMAERGIVVEDKLPCYFIAPRFSADGSQIFLKKAGSSQLYSAPSLGGRIAPSADEPAGTRGSVYAYTQNYNVYTVANGTTYQITHDEDIFFSPMVSGDEQWVLFQGLFTGLWISDIQGLNVENLGRGNNGCFTPDSQFIVFDVSSDNGQEITSSQIHRVKISDLKTHEILTSQVGLKAQRPHVSPDGTKLVFDSNGKIFIMNLQERGMTCMEVEIVE